MVIVSAIRLTFAILTVVFPENTRFWVGKYKAPERVPLLAEITFFWLCGLEPPDDRS